MPTPRRVARPKSINRPKTKAKAPSRQKARSQRQQPEPKALAKARQKQDTHLLLSPRASQAVLDCLRYYRRNNPQDDTSEITAAVIKELTN